MAATGVAAALVMAAAGVGQAQEEGDGEGFKTTTKPYLVGLNGFETEPLLTAGDLVPVTDSPAERYQFVGIPDGLGATQEDPRGRSGDDDDDDDDSGGVTRVFVNHELPQTVTSRPFFDRAFTQKGAFVSEYLLAEDGSVLSGDRAFDLEFQDDTQVDTADSPLRAFSRFCSGFLADSRVGFDRPIYLTGEETSGTVVTRADGTSQFEAQSFDTARGSQSVAIFTNDDGQKEAHALSDQGFFPKENTVVAPNTGNRTVIFTLEDGPARTDNQLYMYVGEKQKRGTVLQRNGLIDGKLFVFAGNDPSRNSEATFENGSTTGRFVEIPREQRQNEIQLEAAADARNAFGFVRIEDGAFGRSNREFFFNTTGSSPGVRPAAENSLGVNYRFEFNPTARNIEQSTARLNVVYNADQITPADDIAVSPDNLETVGRLEVIQEDGTTQSRQEMGQRNRDGSIWTVDGGFTSNAPGQFPRRERIAELTGRGGVDEDGNPVPPGGKIDPTPRFPGIWESSGIIDYRRFTDEDDGLTFLTNVQAHESAPPNGRQDTVEDGQLLILRSTEEDDD